MPRHLTVNDETVVCGPYLGELAGDSYTMDPDDMDCMECEALLGKALEIWPETGFSRVVSYTWGIKK